MYEKGERGRFPLNTLNIIRGVAFAIRGRFSTVPDFVKDSLNGIPNGEATKSDVIAVVTNRLRELESNVGTAKRITQTIALRELLLQDLRDILSLLKSLQEKELTEEYFHVLFHRMKDDFNKHGIGLRSINCTIVDHYPKPYSEMDFWAMNYDISDHKAFGIPVGVFLKRKHLMPLYTPFLMGHELVHAAIGQVLSNHLARGLEDGICDVVGSLYLCSHILPRPLCENMLFNSRLSYPSNQFWQVYTEALFQAFVLYKKIGINGLIDLIKRCTVDGRSVIKDVEKKCLAGIYSDILIPHIIHYDKDINVFADMALGFPKSIVVSPLAYYLAGKVRLGDSLEYIIEENNIDPESGQTALRELQMRVFLVVIDGGKIVADETKALLQVRALRYEPNER